MQRWSHQLYAVNKSTGHRWSPIPKPPPLHVDRLYGTHCVLNTLRAFYNSIGRQHPHRKRLHCLFVRDFRLAVSGTNLDKTHEDNLDRDMDIVVLDGCDNDRYVKENSKSYGDYDVCVPSQYLNLQRILRLAKALRVDVKPVERRELVQLCGERRNQNVVLEVASFKPKDIATCPWHRNNNNNNNNDINNNGNIHMGLGSDTNNDDVLFLDHVVDPNNVGAIIRSAFFMGIQSIVLSSDCAGCSAAVARASAGFIEHMNIYRSVVSTTTFLENTIAQHKARGDLRRLEIYAATTTPWHNITPIKHYEKEGKIERSMRRRLLLLGNEDKGLSLDIVRLCNYAVHVPSLRQRQLEQQQQQRQKEQLCYQDTLQRERRVVVEDDVALLRPREVSLNVSAASAIILAALLAGDQTVEIRPVG